MKYRERVRLTVEVVITYDHKSDRKHAIEELAFNGQACRGSVNGGFAVVSRKLINHKSLKVEQPEREPECLEMMPVREPTRTTLRKCGLLDQNGRLARTYRLSSFPDEQRFILMTIRTFTGARREWVPIHPREVDAAEALEKMGVIEIHTIQGTNGPKFSVRPKPLQKSDLKLLELLEKNNRVERGERIWTRVDYRSKVAARFLERRRLIELQEEEYEDGWRMEARIL